MQTAHMLKWRNGRRSGLKIRCPQGRAGSSPAFSTKRSLSQREGDLFACNRCPRSRVRGRTCWPGQPPRAARSTHIFVNFIHSVIIFRNHYADPFPLCRYLYVKSAYNHINMERKAAFSCIQAAKRLQFLCHFHELRLHIAVAIHFPVHWVSTAMPAIGKPSALAKMHSSPCGFRARTSTLRSPARILRSGLVTGT